MALYSVPTPLLELWFRRASKAISETVSSGVIDAAYRVDFLPMVDATHVDIAPDTAQSNTLQWRSTASSPVCNGRYALQHQNHARAPAHDLHAEPGRRLVRGGAGWEVAEASGKTIGYGFHETWHGAGVGGLIDRRISFGANRYWID